jgi:ArsR family transcriptional regulator
MMAKTKDPDLRLLQAAADPIRLRMIQQLALGGEVCACDFVGAATVSQPTISHHLRVLRESGWVGTERRGTWIWYSLRPEAVDRFTRLASLIKPIDASSVEGTRRLRVVDPADLPIRT